MGWVFSTRPLPDRLAVVVERDVAALGEAAAVVFELHPDLVLAGRDRLVGFGEVVLDAEEVVAVLELAVLDVERPATDRAALRDDHALGAAFRHVDLGRDRVRLVLEREHARLAHAHALEQELACCR